MQIKGLEINISTNDHHGGGYYSFMEDYLLMDSWLLHEENPRLSLVHMSFFEVLESHENLVFITACRDFRALSDFVPRFVAISA